MDCGKDESGREINIQAAAINAKPAMHCNQSFKRASHQWSDMCLEGLEVGRWVGRLERTNNAKPGGFATELQQVPFHDVR